MLGASILRMVINYEPFICGSWIYNSKIIHFINYLCKQSINFDFATGKNNYENEKKNILLGFHEAEVHVSRKIKGVNYKKLF